MALTTVAEYKVWANITDTSLDTPLASHLAVADAKIKRYTGLTLEQQSAYTEYVSGTNENSILLGEAPINSITSMAIVDSDQTVVSTYDSSDYYLDPNALGVIRLQPAGEAVRRVSDLGGGSTRNRWSPQAVFPLGHGNIKVVADVGYATIPEDLKEAVWILVAASMAARGRDPSLAGIAMGDVNATYRDPAMAREAAFALASPWRRIG